jgi:hypothetical protein
MNICNYIYIYMCVCVCVCVFVYDHFINPFRHFSSNFKFMVSLISIKIYVQAKLVVYLEHKRKILREQKSNMKSLLITGLTPAEFSCTHFEHDIHWTTLSSLADSRFLGRKCTLHFTLHLCFHFCLFYVHLQHSGFLF